MKKVLVLVVALFIATPLFAWTGPTASPPLNNTSAPINVGTTDQVKNAGLSINSLAVFGNAILSGASRYLNFNATAGSTGYGIRDNAGVIEFKNSGGTWDNKATVTGNFTVTGNVTAAGYFHSSDKRLKENIHTSPGLDIVSHLRGVTFNWKKDGTQSGGVIAQEVEAVLPSAVQTDANGLKSVDYDQLITPLIEAVKEQQKEIDSLRHEILELKNSR